ncbi:MAG: hypothetical protein A2Y15_07740 [Clostridiales bacterium GWF2_36_10]|nr:MAG: hypothetical protein A2Y15_07740 [Clostridiales bacterium GWF2_36_10]HAN21190.1 hypothetical protein [Clostridiales bacterium]
MLLKNDFITMSLDLNLFFLRIMKEHSFFLEIGFTPKDNKLASEAKVFRMGFENLLSEATNLAYGNVSSKAISSKQFVTQYTADAEKLTSFYTGVPFNTNLTQKEQMLMAGNGRSQEIEQEVYSLNRKAHKLTSALIDFKEKLLHNVLSCRLFTVNYPLLIEHIIREAKLFVKMLDDMSEKRNMMRPEDLINLEEFWNRQMAEHAKFIAGLLDPTEEDLIDTARMFGKEFDVLTAEAKKATQNTFEITETTVDSISATKRLRDFKVAGTEGLLDCKIKSIIIPLLADHVLREANHYLCILGVCNTD